MFEMEIIQVVSPTGPVPGEQKVKGAEMSGLIVMKAKTSEQNVTSHHSLTHTHLCSPRGSFLQTSPVVNDDLPARILTGRITVKPNVKEFSGSSVVFEDGSVLEEVEVVMFATGYDYSFPFLPPGLQAKSGYRLQLYKHVFPPSLTRPTLAVVGFINGLWAAVPLSEMQARWVTRVFKDLSTLPSEETMTKEINNTEIMNQRYVCPGRNPLVVDFSPYMDSLAEQLGVRPNILRLFLKNPRLALQVLMGPCTPYQYRLSGPGQWAGARQAILTQWERVIQPFRSRVLPEPEPRPSRGRSLMVVFSGAALLCCFFIHKQPLCSLFSPSLLKAPQ